MNFISNNYYFNNLLFFKLSLFLLLLTIICNVKSTFIDLNSLSCSVNVCSDLGDPCDQDNILSGLQCYVENRCLNGTCVESLLEGEVCSKGTDCNLGYSCLPNMDNKKTCQKAFYLEYGESCNRTFDCLNSLECIDNKCSTPKTGCYSDVQCDRNSICINGICGKVTLKQDECFIYRTLSCKNRVIPCSLKSFNQSSIGICRDEIPEGNPCLVYRYTCDWNVGQYCQPLEPGSILGKCVKIPPNTLNPCKSIFDCKEYEFCKCDSKSGVGYCLSRGSYIGSYCKEAAKVFMECFANTSCTEPFSLNPLSCIYKYCKEEASCMSLYCTEPMLPVNPCDTSVCNLSLFKPKDLQALAVSITNNLKSKINNNLISLLIILNFIVFLIIK